MWLLALCLTLVFYLPSNNGQYEDFSKAVNNLLFGDLTFIPNLLILPDYTTTSTTNLEVQQFDEEFGSDFRRMLDNLRTDDLIAKYKPIKEKAFKIPTLDEAEINEKTTNDFAEKEYHTISNTLKTIQYNKKAKTETDEILIDATKLFTIQIRNLVCKAIRQRKEYKTDKRFKLGYQFDKVRRIKTEQLKILLSMYDRNRTQYEDDHGFKSATLYSLEMYEKMVALDNDVKKHMQIIEAIYDKREDWEYSTTTINYESV